MASMTTERPSSVKAALSIDVEDWFHTDNMRGVIGRDEWEGCELRVERNTMRMAGPRLPRALLFDHRMGDPDPAGCRFRLRFFRCTDYRA